MTRRILEIGAIIVALGLFAVMGQRLLGADGLLLADGNPVFGDFMAFWSAGRVALEGQAAFVHQPPVVQEVQWNEVPGMRWVATWNSPPHFLLIASALALLPYPVAALTWLGATGALYLGAALKLLGDKRALVFALTAPAALYHLGSIQTGLYIAGVTGLALYWLDKRPLTAGALVGLLAIKPHMAVLWPLYLVLTQRWRAFFAAAASLALFTLAAILAFGWESIPRFLANLSATQDLIDLQQVNRATYASLYGNLLAMGAPAAIAMNVHIISALAAIGAAALVFLRGDARTQGAALCAATLLTTPYGFFYDQTLSLVAIALLAPPRGRFEFVAFILAWSAGLSLAVAAQGLTLPICPVANWLVLAAALLRTARQARAG